MTKWALGIAITAVFVISMMGIAIAEIASHLDIKTAHVTDNGTFVIMQVVVTGEINDGISPPGDPTGEGFYGYAALTSDFQNMVAATYHQPIVDSSEQPGWHSHIVSAASSKKCASGIKVAFASPDPPGKTTTTNNPDTIVVNQVPSELVGDLTGIVLSFELSVEGKGKKQDVCINPVDTFDT